MNWADLSWSGEAERQRRKADLPRNRRTVIIILCPTCDGTDIRCHRRTAVASYWTCTAAKQCPDWKEPANAGQDGKVHPA